MEQPMNIPQRIVQEMHTFFDNGTLSKTAFAKEIGVSRQQLHNILNGKYPPRGTRLKRIIYALDKFDHPLPDDL
jgi:DNA-binding XRE family transcriptional regulator